MKLLILIFAGASGIMLYLLLNQKICLDRMNRVLDEICSGNFNQRIRINSLNKQLGLLSAGINRLTEKLQSVSVEKLHLEESRKRMISNISHDLRTPLTSMLGYIELVENEEDMTEDDRKRYIEVIKAKGKNLALLLEEFFQLAKIDANDMILHPEKINICEIVENTAAAFYDEITAAGVQLELNIPDTGAFVEADRVCLLRVMENLLSNAVKYGAGGGVVGIGIYAGPETIRTEVWDKGAGITETDLPFIFDRLYTSDKSRNHKFRGKGSGIGLTIARKLIEKQGGSISVTSIPHEKTSFSFELKRIM